MVANPNRDDGFSPASLTKTSGGAPVFTADPGDPADGDCCPASCTFEAGACHDGCTTGEVCRAEPCEPGAPVICDDGDA